MRLLRRAEEKGKEKSEEVMTMRLQLLALLAVLVIFAGCIAIPVSKNVTQPPAQPPAQPPTMPPSQPPANPNPSEPPVQPPAQPPEAPNESETSPPSENWLNSSEISYVSETWTIYGTFYPSKNSAPTRAVILAHKLGSDRSEWPDEIIQRIHDELPNAAIIAIDMRGHGKSTNMGSYTGFDTATYKDMKTDILSVNKYLNPKYPTIKELYVVGSSFGSTAAILAAQQDRSITKVAMISPGMKYHDVDISKAIEAYPQPLLVAAAGNDAYSVQALHNINGLANPNQLTSKVYIASAHGAALFEETKTDEEPLEEMLVKFLKE